MSNRPETTGSETPASTEVLDLRGLRCPLPVLHARRALARMAAGHVIEVRCTDPLAGLDIPNLVRETGDMLLADRREGGEFRFRIRKGREAPDQRGRRPEDPSANAGVDDVR